MTRVAPREGPQEAYFILKVRSESGRQKHKKNIININSGKLIPEKLRIVLDGFRMIKLIRSITQLGMNAPGIFAIFFPVPEIYDVRKMKYIFFRGCWWTPDTEGSVIRLIDRCCFPV